jgi:SpoVK/Ycf46/Vps4 family AAA+-type ATPase
VLAWVAGCGCVISDSVLDSLRLAVEAAPDDLGLRAHLAAMLAESGRRDEAVFHAAAVLSRDPRHALALEVIAQTAATRSQPMFSPHDDPDAALAWLDGQLADLDADRAGPREGTVSESGFVVESVTERLADVGGMDAVKAQLEASFLLPLRDQDLGEYFGRTGRGGLLLYGPPGCGKTFLARALAGELGAGFLTVSLSDVLDMYVGQSERNLAEVFRVARRAYPCVVFFDEIDALGQKRSQVRNTGRRGVVNQLLEEMDGVSAGNSGVFILAATNHPWDVDVALRRPGRFDRTLLVAPPDCAARSAIFTYHLRGLPTDDDIDVASLALSTEGFSGADISYVCRVAAESAMLDSARSGIRRPISHEDLSGALTTVRPSIEPWLDTARTVVEFANGDGSYDELAEYLRSRKQR